MYTFAKATFTQQLRDWIGSYVRVFKFYEGVTQLIIKPDNLKSGVTRANCYNRFSISDIRRYSFIFRRKPCPSEKKHTTKPRWNLGVPTPRETDSRASP